MKTRHSTLGLAAALGIAAFASPALAQEVYMRGAEPVGPGVVILESPGYGPAPGERIILREVPPPGLAQEPLLTQEPLPDRIIVTDPAGGPYAREVYVRRPAPPAPLPPYAHDEGCRTFERESPSGLVTVSTVCE